jgi:hypothetical protein
MEYIFVLYRDYPHIYWFSKAFYNHQNNERIREFDQALTEISKPYSQKAYFNNLEPLYLFPQFNCKVSVAWTFPHVNSLAMSALKSSPHFDIINNAYLKLMETGNHRHVIARNYGNGKHPCNKELKGTPFGTLKILGTYLVLSTGMALSIAIFSIEMIASKMKTRANALELHSETMWLDPFKLGLSQVSMKWTQFEDMKNTDRFQMELSELLDFYT